MSFKAIIQFVSNKWVGNIFRIVLGVGLMVFLIDSGALKPVLLHEAIFNRPLSYIGAFFLYAFVLESLAFLRWYLLLRQAQVAIPIGLIFRLHLIGLFFSGLLPGGNGGDFVKGYYLIRGAKAGEGAAALSTIVIDRIAGFFGLIWLGTMVSLWRHDLWRVNTLLKTQSFLFLGLSTAALLLTVFFFLPFKKHPFSSSDGSPKGFFSKLFFSLMAFRAAPGLFVWTFLLSFSVHVCLVGVYWLCGNALQVDLPFSGHAFVAPTLTLMNGLPLSPAGMGVGEAGGKILYKAVGVLKGATEIPALVHTIIMITAIVCAPVYFWQKKRE